MSPEAPMSSDTPRTDRLHAECWPAEGSYTTMLEHARELERELAAATRDRSQHCPECERLAGELESARAVKIKRILPWFEREIDLAIRSRECSPTLKGN